MTDVTEAKNAGTTDDEQTRRSSQCYAVVTADGRRVFTECTLSEARRFASCLPSYTEPKVVGPDHVVLEE